MKTILNFHYYFTTNTSFKSRRFTGNNTDITICWK